MNIRIQMGLEIIDGGRRKVKLTPVDHTHDIHEAVAQALLLIVGVADMSDLEPGDGEVDVRLGELKVLAKGVTLPGLVRDVVQYAQRAGITGRANVFIRIRRVE